MRKKRFFSISVDLITANKLSPIDLFINSSTIKGREKFVKIHHRGKNLSREELNSYLSKYHQLYAQESQRKLYLREIFLREDLKDTSKVEAMKSVAIDHLKLLFKSQDEVMGDSLFDNELMNCRESVVEMIDFISDKSLYNMQKTLAEVYTHDSYTYDHSVSVSFYSIIFLKFLKPESTQNELVTIGSWWLTS